MSLRIVLPFGIAGMILLGSHNALQSANAEGDTRTLSFRHLHTQETITVTFKRNGRYDDAALKQLDWFMRDWRKNQSTKMDPHVFDILWEAYREVGGKQAIEVICGYRAPGTNEMLRARSTGVAQNSNHTTGQAIDFAIPGVDLSKLREVGLRLQRGGVGFYPTSGSPFVHMDTGSVRHWPRMTHDQLAKVFPDGRTVHVPSDGQPLAKYALALADVERRGNEPNAVSLAAARNAGVITASAESKPKRNFLASLFSTKKPDAEEADDEAPQTASLAYAAVPTPVSTTAVTPLPRPALRVKPMGVAVAAVPVKLPLPRLAAVTLASNAMNAFSVPFTAQLSGGAPNPGSPWMRAAMLTPSVSDAMTTSTFGAPQMLPLVTMLHKPAESLVMTFSDDPHLGMTTARFDGTAVVFLATATFSTQMTASLR